MPSFSLPSDKYDRNNESQFRREVERAIASTSPTYGTAANWSRSEDGSVGRTVTEKLKEAVSVRDFGAVGDGLADDTTAIRAAHTASSKVHYPVGTYKISEQIDIIWPDAITITADQGAVIDASDSTDDFGFFIGGTPIPAGGVADLYNRATRAGGASLSSSTVRGDRSLTVSGLGLAQGDIIRISSSDLFTDSYSVSWKGELAEVKSVSGSPSQTVTLCGQLMDDYDSATTKIFKIGSPVVSISNLKLVRNADKIGLQVWEARNVNLCNIEVEGARATGIAVAYCFGGQVRDCYVHDAYSSSNSYGIAVSTCQNLSVIGGVFHGARIGMSCGGYEPCRFISILGGSYDCIDSGTAPVGLDTHGNTEYITIIGNHIKGGAGCHGRNLIFSKNTVQQDQAGMGVNIYYQTDSDYTIVEGNTVRSTGGYGHFYFNTEQDNKTAKSIICSNNVSVGAIEFTHGGIWFAPFSTSGTGFTVESMSLVNNHVDAASSTAGAGILINEGTGGGAAGDRWTIKTLNVQGGYYRGWASAVLAPLTGDQVFVQGGMFRSIRDDSGYGAIIDNFDDTRIIGPYLADEDTAKGLRITTGSYLTINGLTLDNANANGGLQLETGTYQWTMRDIVQINCTGNIKNQNSTTNGIGLAWTGFTHEADALPIRTHYATAAPTGGTYSVGDRCFNSAPTAGAPKSWVCTTAGTPGTWTSEGNL